MIISDIKSVYVFPADKTRDPCAENLTTDFSSPRPTRQRGISRRTELGLYLIEKRVIRNFPRETPDASSWSLSFAAGNFVRQSWYCVRRSPARCFHPFFTFHTFKSTDPRGFKYSSVCRGYSLTNVINECRMILTRVEFLTRAHFNDESQLHLIGDKIKLLCTVFDSAEIYYLFELFGRCSSNDDFQQNAAQYFSTRSCHTARGSFNETSRIEIKLRIQLSVYNRNIIYSKFLVTFI